MNHWVIVIAIEFAAQLADMNVDDVGRLSEVIVPHLLEQHGTRHQPGPGISLEVCAAFPAIAAIGKGREAYVAVDVPRTFSETKRQVGLLRML